MALLVSVSALPLPPVDDTHTLNWLSTSSACAPDVRLNTAEGHAHTLNWLSTSSACAPDVRLNTAEGHAHTLVDVARVAQTVRIGDAGRVRRQLPPPRR